MDGNSRKIRFSSLSARLYFLALQNGKELSLNRMARADSVSKRLFFYLGCLIAVFSVAALTVSGQVKTGKAGEWSGTILYSSCNADEAFNEAADCTKNIVPGAMLSLYDDTSRVMYSLEPQEKVTAHAGDSVTVRGVLDGDTIRVGSVETMTIGLAVGQKAPAFSARDQFGHVQTLESLKGANGTVLLFFRSADW
jgi:hypothetical protein